MRIAFVMRRHPRTRVSPTMLAVVGLLEEWRVTVDIICPEDDLVDLGDIRVDHDLYVLKSGSDLALSVAGALDALGAPSLNPYRTTIQCRDRIVVTRILRAAGVPVPDTFVAVDVARLGPLLDDGPLAVRPYRSALGTGVQVVWDADELHNIVSSGQPVFAQRYHGQRGDDRKLYCLGEHLFGVMRTWPARTYKEKVGEPFTVTAELREIALRCGAALGIELFGLDIIVSDGQPYVVDVDPFPGFKGVPDAALRLADYIYAAKHPALAPSPLTAAPATLARPHLTAGPLAVAP